MEVKEAAQTAKVYLLDIFEDEDISDLGLEEVIFDELSNTMSRRPEANSTGWASQIQLYWRLCRRIHL